MKGYYLGFPMKRAKNSESETHEEKKIRLLLWLYQPFFGVTLYIAENLTVTSEQEISLRKLSSIFVPARISWLTFVKKQSPAWTNLLTLDSPHLSSLASICFLWSHSTEWSCLHPTNHNTVTLEPDKMHRHSSSSIYVQCTNWIELDIKKIPKIVPALNILQPDCPY